MNNNMFGLYNADTVPLTGESRWYVLLFIMLILLSVTSCDTRTGNPVTPDFQNPDWLSKFEASLSIETYGGGAGPGTSLWTKEDPGQTSLSLNGGNHVVGQVEYNPLQDGYRTTYAGLNAFPEAIIEYELILRGKTYTGNLMMPATVSVAFPTFVQRQNYSFSWATAKHPNQFVIKFIYNYSGTQYTIRKQTSGLTRTYTLEKNLWDDRTIDLQDIVLQAINYNTKAKTLIVYAITEDSY